MISFELRPYDEKNDDFLFDLYASTRAEELDAWGWTDQHSARKEPALVGRSRAGLPCVAVALDASNVCEWMGSWVDITGTGGGVLVTAT